MKTLRRLYNRFFGIAGAAHVGSRKMALVDVYEDEGVWYFSQCDANHQNGQLLGPFVNAEDAIAARVRWIEKNPGIAVVYVGGHHDDAILWQQMKDGE